MPGHDHGKSIKNPRVYEALRRKRHMSKTKAAKISNGLLKRKVKKGKARRGKRR
jgi:hypothetical protein